MQGPDLLAFELAYYRGFAHVKNLWWPVSRLFGRRDSESWSWLPSFNRMPGEFDEPAWHPSATCPCNLCKAGA